MKKKITFFIVLFFTLLVDINAIDITKVKEVNQEIINGKLNEIDGNSYLEMDYRSINSFSIGEDIYKYYPRIKKVKDYYILTYHGNRYSESSTGGSIFYSISRDLVNWSTPVELWRPFNYNNNQSQFDRTIFSNCDILPLKDGRILIYAIYHSKHYYTSNPYASGVVSKICFINDTQLECAKGTEIDELDSNQNIIGKYDIGAFIHNGPTWEPHAFYDNSGNIVMTFSSGEPINKISDFKHSSGGVGTIVSKDGGYTWSDAKYSAFKYIGNYDNNGKNVNYYTTQMAVTQLLNDGNYFSVYEMWSPNNNYEIPSGYSIGGSIFSNNYDFSVASNIKVSDVIAESLTENPASNDPRNQQSYSGDEKGFFTITSPAAAPYIIQFPSGEVIVSYNNNSKQFLKMITNLNNISDDNNILQTFEHGYWGAIDLNGNNSIISSFPYISNHSVSYGILYLNKTINSIYLDKIIIDGNNNDWKDIDIATFVGSDSQAQSIIRFTHDDNKIYLLVELLDKDLQEEDQITIKINSLNKMYNLVLNKNATKLLDENNNEIVINSKQEIINSEDVEKKGIIYEVAVDKKYMNILDSFDFYVLLENKDENLEIIQDIISNTDINNVNTWLKVKLVKNNNEELDSNNENNDKENNDKESDIVIENIDSVPNTLKTVSLVLYIIVFIIIIGTLLLIYKNYNKKKK